MKPSTHINRAMQELELAQKVLIDTEKTITEGDEVAIGDTFRKWEKYILINTYILCGRNLRETAKVLAIPERTLHRRIRTYKINCMQSRKEVNNGKKEQVR